MNRAGTDDAGPGTTHDPRRGGRPSLVLAPDNDRLPPDGRVAFPLRDGLTTIGSGPTCDIRLTGLEPVHATVEHDHRDELVVHDRSADSSTTVNGEPAPEGRVLRTGARLEVGAWTLTYRRAEHADHGRPYGGRIGGELGHQPAQPDTRPSRAGDREDPS